MKKEPIHKNLNTSFVSLSALVRYLGNLQFVGSIRVEFASYEADIVFTRSRTIQAREYNHVDGRISHGKLALERILLRGREPHGRIHVYKYVTEGYAGMTENVFVERSIAANARKLAEAAGGTANNKKCEFMSAGRNSENAEMLNAISDVLRTVDESLAGAKLSFSAAFRLACESIAKDYKFLRRKRNALVYREGSVFVSAQADAQTIASAVFAALRPIFRRLKSEAKYEALFHRLSNALRATAEQNQNCYQRLGLTRYIEDLIGMS
jgi:hypothetical protein